jgi:hypothetical protein
MKKKEKKVLIISTVALFFIVGITAFASSHKQETFRLEQQKKQQLEEKKLADSLAREQEKVEQFKKDSTDLGLIKSYSVKKISGSHPYGGSTKVSYQNFVQLMKDELIEGRKEMKSEDEISDILNIFKENQSGRIQLDITRNTIGSANLEYFTIIIKDKAEKEIYRKELEWNSPNPSYSSDDWWNIGLEEIPNMKNQEFFVYVVDELDDVAHKFLITPKY